MKIKQVGFIGQGFVGRHMADDFEERGFDVVRYALESEYVGNREAIADCDVVFIAVPTPTTPQGFDVSVVEKVLTLVGKGKVAVIKSTVLPGSTKRLQKMFPDITVFHSPEFLRERFAAEDTRRPERNIIGIPEMNDEYKQKANHVLALLPRAPYEVVCSAEEAELIKYGGNGFLTLKVVYMNLIYEAAKAVGADYQVVAAAIAADTRIGKSHMTILDERQGRGAGGHCFPKDWIALREFYETKVDDELGLELLEAVEQKNRQLLTSTNKDLDLLRSIYGEGGY